MITYFFVLLFVCFALPCSLLAQPLQMQFERIGVKEGLSVPTIRKVVQDQQGFIWVATADGLNRYDGLQVKVYRHLAKDSTSLANNYVRTLLIDSQQRLWVGMWWGGLCLYQPDKDSFVRFAKQEKDSTSLSHNNVNTIYEDRQGNIWVGTWEGLNLWQPQTKNFKRYLHHAKIPTSLGTASVNTICQDTQDDHVLWVGTYLDGVDKFNTQTQHFQHFKHQLNNEQSITHDDIREACADRKGQIWFATPQGLTVYDPKKQSFRRIQQENYKQKGLQTNDILSLRCDSKDRLWIGTGQGLYYYDDKQDYFYHYANSSEDAMSLSENSILCIYEDTANILWVGTWAGLNKYNPLTNQLRTFKHKADDKNSLANNMVWSINADSQGAVWIGTQQGVSCWKPKENQFLNYTINSVAPFKIPYDNIGEVLLDKEGTLWIGTWGGGLIAIDTATGAYKHWRTDNKKYLVSPIKSDNIHNIFQDSKGRLWLGTFGAGLYLYEKQSQQFTQFNYEIGNPKSLVDVNIRFITEDKQGRIWIGTNQGLSLFDEKSKQFVNFKNDPNNLNSLGHHTINALHAHSNGTQLWVGTMASLDCYNLQTQQWKSYAVQPDLGTVSVNAILEDAKGKLWLATSKGILCFDTQTQQFKVYASEEMLNGNELHLKASEKTKDGYMLFGGTNGFLYFHPDSLQTNTLPVRMVLTNLRINNEIVQVGNYEFLPRHISQLTSLDLSHDQSSFTLDFAGINYTLPQKNQFIYKIEGLEDKWQQLGNQNFLSFLHLPNGSYTLYLQGINSDGVKSEEGIKLKITIRPPWWQTTWAKTLAVLLVALLLYAIYKSRIRQIKTQKEKLEHIVSLRTQEILNQKEEINVIAENLQLANNDILQKTAAIQQAYNLIEVQNKEITDSMRYASRIQQAMLPFTERIQQVFSPEQYFILYKPKDIVSGDFYWFEASAHKVVWVVADCTGHGIPGAFMSFIGIAYLENIVIAQKIWSPNQILAELHKGINHALKQATTDNRDGMDIVIVVLDKAENQIENQVESKTASKTKQNFTTLTYSGAMNPLYFVQNQTNEQTGKQEKVLVEIKADKMPIGGESSQQRNYHNHVIPLESAGLTHLYLCSDGYQDQFGGEQNKKFKVKNFKDLLQAVHEKPMAQQKTALDQTITKWIEIGKETQTDDITVVGVRL